MDSLKLILKKLNFLVIFVIVSVFFGCNDNFIDNFNLPNDETKVKIKVNKEDSIIAFDVDTTTTNYKSLQLIKNKSKLKVASAQSYIQSATESLFDLRDLPVNIIVNESNTGTRFLTAQRVKMILTEYSKPAVFAQKKNDDRNSTQTFYLKYVPLVGQYYITTKFDGKTYPMSIGSYTSDPNNKFLFARKGEIKGDDAFIFNYSDDLGSSYYIQNSLWIGADDPNNPTPWNVWNYTLGCNNSSTYFDKYRNIGKQKFTIAPLENYTITKIEYNNDQTALLEKAPDFVVTWSANNATSVAQQMSTNFGNTASKTSSFSRTLGITLQVSASVKVGIPFIADGKITTTFTTSTTATWGESETTQDSRNYNFQIIVPANRRVVASATVSRYHMKLGYTAYLTGVNTGRTIKVQGYWDGVDCSEIVTSFTEYDLLTNAFIKTTTINGKAGEVIKL